MSKLARGSFLVLIGNIIFRFGGYVYRFLMAILLGPAAYGILGLTLPLQGVFQVLAAGGLPPAIAKYVSQYTALEEDNLARQTIYTSLKIMVFLGLFFGLVMVFFVAPFLAYDFFSKPEALLPLQAVGLITPFSVIVGAFRGAFQGVYKMEYILYTRAVEQVFMILFATTLVIFGFSVFGAVIGSVLGFAASAIVSVIIFKKYMWKYIPQPPPSFKFPLIKELKLARQLVTFAIPVSVTALAEMAIYGVCTIIMGKFLVTELIGYFTAADPIARLPLIISSSIATTMLPASSTAFSTNDQQLLSKYIYQAYKYCMLLVIPMCIGIAMFAKTIMATIYFTNDDYVLGAMALSILVVGMTFYSFFTISTSIIQGIGNPKTPMYILIGGATLTIILSWFMIPVFGIEGGSLAITIVSFIMMIPVLLITFKMTKFTPPYKFFGKVVIASSLMALFILLLPQNIIGLIIGIILCPIIYLIVLILLKTFSNDDIAGVRRFSSKFGPLNSIISRFLDIMEKFL